MSLHFARERERLKEQAQALADLVEDNVGRAARAFLDRDAALADAAIDGDKAIDAGEIALEEECLKLLALYQPVAEDLRFVVGVVKMNDILERIGDLAVSLARKARSLAKKPPIPTPPEIAFMAERSAAMLHDATDSFLRHDAPLARAVRERDSEVDAAKKAARKRAEAAMAATPAAIPAYVSLIAAARNLERIADFAVDLAECVIYAVDGDIVRHNHVAEPEE